MNEGRLCLDVFNLAKKTLDLLDSLVSARVLALVILEFLPNALSVEGMQTWENIEFPLKDGLRANITLLCRINGYVLVSLLSLFLSKFLSTLAVFLKLLLQIKNLRVVLIKAFTQMLLHVFHLCILWE